MLQIKMNKILPSSLEKIFPPLRYW